MAFPNPTPHPSRQEDRSNMRMSIKPVIELVLGGVLLAGLTVLARHVQPDLPRLTFYSGLVGGGLCVLYGALRR